MAQTKMITRIVSDQRQRQLQRREAAAPRKRVRSGVKNIEGRAADCPTSQMTLTSESQGERIRYKFLGAESLREL